jgi:hypothetical protein
LRMCVLKQTVCLGNNISVKRPATGTQSVLIRSDFFMYKNISHPRGRPFVV